MSFGTPGFLFMGEKIMESEVNQRIGTEKQQFEHLASNREHLPGSTTWEETLGRPRAIICPFWPGRASGSPGQS